MEKRNKINQTQKQLSNEVSRETNVIFRDAGELRRFHHTIRLIDFSEMLMELSGTHGFVPISAHHCCVKYVDASILVEVSSRSIT